jgi:hypothetical protein
MGVSLLAVRLIEPPHGECLRAHPFHPCSVELLIQSEPTKLRKIECPGLLFHSPDISLHMCFTLPISERFHFMPFQLNSKEGCLG